MPTVRANGIAVYYEEQGSGDPVLLIMGLAGDSLAWMFQRDDFAKRYRTMLFDNRGVGRSDKPPGPYTTAQMADDAVAVLDALGVGRAHVVGVSMGGMIAQELALRHPQRVRGLVLGCTYARPDEAVKQTLAAALAAFGGSSDAQGAIRLKATQIDPLAFFQLLVPLTFSAQFLTDKLPVLMQVVAGTIQHGFSIEGILAQVAATQSHDTLARLAQIRAPTLVIAGERDQLVPAHNSDLLAARIAGAKLVKVTGGSHGFNFELPEVFNREVLGFLGACGA